MAITILSRKFHSHCYAATVVKKAPPFLSIPEPILPADKRKYNLIKNFNYLYALVRTSDCIRSFSSSSVFTPSPSLQAHFCSPPDFLREAQAYPDCKDNGSYTGYSAGTPQSFPSSPAIPLRDIPLRALCAKAVTSSRTY